MKILKKALSLFLTAVIMVGTMCAGTVNAAAGTADEFLVSGRTAADGSYCIQLTTSNFFVIDLTALRLEDHIITVEYFCKNNTYKFSLDYIGRFPYPIFHINDELNNNIEMFDYEWNTTWVDDQAINSDIFLYAKTAEHIAELKSCSLIRITCSGKLNSRIVYVDESIPVKHIAGSGSDTQEEDAGTDETEKDDAEIKDISALNISKPANYAYTGKNRKAAISVTDGSYTLKKGTDYTLTYKNCKNIGTASVTIKGKGNYSGEKTLTYQILPKKVNLKAYRNSSNKIVLKWDAVKGADKYQIYYAVGGGQYKKLATATKSTTTITLSGAKFNKANCKFIVRAVAVEDGKTYYGPFSEAANVKAKK